MPCWAAHLRESGLRAVEVDRDERLVVVRVERRRQIAAEMDAIAASTRRMRHCGAGRVGVSAAVVAIAEHAARCGAEPAQPGALVE